MCVCEKDCVHACLCMRQRKRVKECDCVCVCVCMGVCVCVCVCACVCACVRESKLHTTLSQQQPTGRQSASRGGGAVDAANAVASLHQEVVHGVGNQARHHMGMLRAVCLNDQLWKKGGL